MARPHEGARTSAPEPVEQPPVEGRIGRFGFEDPEALPFDIEFREVYPAPGRPPSLHSFQSADLDDGSWLMMGGRGAPFGSLDKLLAMTGEHTFIPSSAPEHENFPKVSFNTSIWVYHPVTGELASFDTKQLPDEIGVPLRGTSQQSWYDRDTGDMWIVGGFTWNEDGSSMGTFDSMIHVNAHELASAVRNYAPATEVSKLFRVLYHPMLEVTGGELVKSGDTLYLVFGQDYVGEYFAFGDQGKRPQVQAYTQEIRAIEFVPGKFEILDISSLPQNDPREFHRRDLNVAMTRDARSGETVVGAYGGVFKDGGPGGFEHPILFDPKRSTITVQHEGVQLFNGYATATIGLWSDRARIMSRVFFGGIGKGVYHVHAEKPGLDNDGMPYVSDISVLTHESDGSWKEYVLPKPVPGNQLLASNGTFFINPELRRGRQVEDDEIILVDELPHDESTLIGWIFGGIWAGQPQPPKHPDPKHDAVPTMASDRLYEVHLTPGRGPAIPVLP